MIGVEDWAEIRRLHRAERMPIRAIARKLGISRNTVRRAVASDRPPKYQRAPKGSIVDAVEPQIKELLAVWPDMPVTVIAERIGWQRGLTVLRDRVRELRGEFLPADPASRTVYEPGELAQCDLWFPPAEIPLGFGQTGCPPVLVMVCGYSRWIAARMLPSRTAADLIAGHWRLLRRLGSVPRALVWDNEPAVGSWRGGRPQLSEDFAAFAGLLAVRVIQCKPADPEAKGLVERANGYLETSFLPGRIFASPTDFNVQLTDWLTKANRRIHRALQARPSDRLEADKARMLPLPAVDPPAWWKTSLRLPRDHYVRVDTNDYSVHPLAVGRRVEVTADLEQVVAVCDGTEVARHARCWARHQSLTDPVHAQAAGSLRRQPTALATAVDLQVEQRSLADYDRIFHVIDGGAR
ncbi:IS21 family transposase [Streptomyces sp. WMMC500]|uniref:IS21 family transposase n=1 Tax=Streptomyces sp. WMMC500 TaxID=3015154 RepID=UPI00248C7281|nr:IS21 family transposase [Streptomyces sp. WMMC500]WBB64660.1 IS21 family transposase [Streptomyces sp. WMMC500]